jgi:hypothetical protein
VLSHARHRQWCVDPNFSDPASVSNGVGDPWVFSARPCSSPHFRHPRIYPPRLAGPHCRRIIASASHWDPSPQRGVGLQDSVRFLLSLVGYPTYLWWIAVGFRSIVLGLSLCPCYCAQDRFFFSVSRRIRSVWHARPHTLSSSHSSKLSPLSLKILRRL